MTTRIQLVLLLVLSGIMTSHAQSVYWVGTGVSAKAWSNTANWSASSGGTGGAALPGAGDNVVFDGALGFNAPCIMDISVTIKTLTLNGYTSSLTQASTLNVSGLLAIATGTFTGGTQDITAGSFSQTGGIFISTSATMMITGNADFNSGTFNPNNGTIDFAVTGSSAVTITSAPSTTLNNIIISSNNGYTTFHTVSNNLIANNVTFDLTNGGTPGTINFFIGSSGSLTVNGTLTFSAGPVFHYLTGGKIYAKGDIKLDCALSNPIALSNTGTIEINGNGDQNLISTVAIGQNRLPNIIINKPPGGKLNLAGVITSCGPNWTWISGNIVPGTSTLFFYQPSGGLPILVSGNHALGNVLVELDHYSNGLTVLNNLTVDNLTLNSTSSAKITLSSGTVTVNNTLNFVGGNSIVLTGGIIFAKGDINLSASYTLLDNLNTSTIVISGTTDQMVTGNTTLGACLLPNIIINKPSGTVTFKNNISLQGEWTYINGTVDAITHGSTVYINSTYVSGVNRTIDGQGTTSTMKFYNLRVQNNYNSVVLGGELNVAGNLTIEGVGPSILTKLNTTGGNNYPVTLGGDLNGLGTFIPNNSTVTLDGSLDQIFSQALPISIKTLEVNKPFGKVNLLAPLSIQASGQLKLTKGIIIVPASGSNTLTLKNLATTVPALGSATSYIDGPLIFEVGVSGTRVNALPLGVASMNAWRPAEFTVQHSTSSTFVYKAEIHNSPAAMLGYSVPASLLYVSGVRYLQIAVVAPTSPASTFMLGSVKLYFGPDDQVNNLSYLAVAMAQSLASANPTSWTDITSATSTGTGSPYLTGSITSSSFIPSSGAVSFKGLFALATKTGTPLNVNPLPIEISSFTVEAQSDNAVLQWITQVEINNDYFVIERAEGNQPFSEKARIKGAGTSKSPGYYSWLDKNLPAGKLYYRLKQVDFDGKFTYSKVISLSRQDAQELPFTIYPLPVTSATVYFSSTSTVRIISSTGQTLSSYENVEQIDVSNLTAGVYYIINEKGSVRKMIIMR